MAAAVTALLLLAVPLLPDTDPASELPTHKVTRGELLVTVTEQGTLESSNNLEIKCKVRGGNTIIWVIDERHTSQAGR